MKATGIVRRIDELGRIVIPKEMRRTLRIRECDPLELFTMDDGSIVLRKYSPVTQLGSFADEYAQALYGCFGCNAFICDVETIAAAAGPQKRLLQGKAISASLIKLLENKRVAKASDGVRIELTSLRDPAEVFSQYLIAPIIAGGDVMGGVALCSQQSLPKFDIAHEQALKTAALYFGKMLES
ncbi:MAG TPA: stage V sporulation T C-terminal domain-containing protein [Eubacteriales bacterium]|nr:stage V sporulation T C-terminal domain-containing protein [Clostridia bacterium]HRV73575.1 stage V sporulation T C-terminal domain-containing protein [Eubacteriales bacterium]